MNAQIPDMKKEQIRRHIVLPLLAMLAFAALAGCRSAEYEPIPARPIAVQPVVLPPASAAGATAMPVAVAVAPQATSVAGVEVRPSPIARGGGRTKAVLVVQNHTGREKLPFALATLGDWLQTALGAADFAVINPHDAIGTEQNTGS